jgi:hypothetical protein
VQIPENINLMNYFPTVKVVDRVYASVDRERRRPTVDHGHRPGQRVPERGGTLTGVRPPAAPVHQSSPAGAQWRDEGTGSSARASPELGRWRGGRAMAVARRGHGKLGGEGFRRGRGEEKGAVRCGVLRGSSAWLW